MISAGDYRYLFSYFQMTRTSDGVTGDAPKNWGTSPYTNNMGTPNATYWGTEELTTGTIETEFGAPRTRWEGTVRFRNLLSLSAQDRLQGGWNDNTLYEIDGLWHDWPNNQTVCNVHSIDIND